MGSLNLTELSILGLQRALVHLIPQEVVFLAEGEEDIPLALRFSGTDRDF